MLLLPSSTSSSWGCAGQSRSPPKCSSASAMISSMAFAATAESQGKGRSGTCRGCPFMRSSAHADPIASSDAAKRIAICAKVWRPNGDDYGDRRMMPTDQALGRPLSYAQNMEDYHLDVAFGGARQGRYVDIGGGHPVAGSVSFWFYQRGWSGIVIEPQPDLAALHRRLRPRDTLVEAVIGRTSGDTEFFRIDRLHGLSTTIRGNAEAARQHGVSFETMTLP